MDNDDNALYERIVNEIFSVFNKDRDLISFEIIQSESNQNKSPVIHVEHNLGLESWCIKHLYLYCHHTVMQSKLCTKYIQNESLIKYINCAILINPDCAAYWNLRRHLVEKNMLNLTSEFKFSKIVLSSKPKSAEAFAFRRWLYLFQSNLIGTAFLKERKNLTEVEFNAFY